MFSTFSPTNVATRQSHPQRGCVDIDEKNRFNTTGSVSVLLECHKIMHSRK